MAIKQMRYGAVLPGGTATEQLELAVLAEQAGWDGVFVWEAAYGVMRGGCCSAMAARTTRVRLGTMLTPLPWRRPWKVASQVATLDQLSGGRAILAVGVGAVDTDLPDTGEVTDLRERAELLDEGIDLVRTLWDGGTSYHGQHYSYQTGRLDLTGAARPVQPRIPIWVVGVWPAQKSMRRALRCDGVIPQYGPLGYEPSPAQARAVRAWLSEQGAADDFDVIADGETSAQDAAGVRRRWRPGRRPAVPGGWRPAGKPGIRCAIAWWLAPRG